VNWLIVGAGALGSILAAHLAKAGEGVTLLARGARVQWLRVNGVQIKGLTEISMPVAVVDDPGRIQKTDVLILTVKTYDTQAALAPLRHLRVDGAFSVQNGMAKNDQLAAVFGRRAVLGCAADFSGELHADGVVQFTRNEGLYIGELSSGRSARAEKIASILSSAGIRTTAEQDIQAVEWSKFVGWLALTPLAVLTRRPTYEILMDAHLARLQVTLAEEAAQIAAKLGISLQDMTGVSPAKTLVSCAVEEWVSMSRSYGEAMRTSIPGHKMSALQDLERGRRLEIEETFGYAVNKAAELGVSVPALDACYRLMAGFARD
jgi:2-dehydropantoate 2-reductase